MVGHRATPNPIGIANEQDVHEVRVIAKSLGQRTAKDCDDDLGGVQTVLGRNRKSRRFTIVISRDLICSYQGDVGL